MPFNRKLLGDLRPNQIITTFGPGSIVDAVKDSVTILDTSYWKDRGKKSSMAGSPRTLVLTASICRGLQLIGEMCR